MCSLAAVPRDLWDRYELSFSESLNLDSDALADFAYPCVPRSRMAFGGIPSYFFPMNARLTLHRSRAPQRIIRAAIATFALHVLLRASLGATDALSSRRNVPSSSSHSRSGKLADTAEARLEELRRSTQGTMHRWAGAGGQGSGLVYTMVRNAFSLPHRGQWAGPELLTD